MVVKVQHTAYLTIGDPRGRVTEAWPVKGMGKSAACLFQIPLLRQHISTLFRVFLYFVVDPPIMNILLPIKQLVIYSFIMNYDHYNFNIKSYQY